MNVSKIIKIRVNAILPWVDDRTPMMQFEEYTKALIIRMNKSSKKNGRKKGKETIKSSVSNTELII